MDSTIFIEQFHDHLAPKLDTYEQAIYLYIFRHSRLKDKAEVVIGFKSARSRMACGIGEKGRPMSENTAYEKLQSLQKKGCIEIVDTERAGRRIRLRLPAEIPGLIVERSDTNATPDLETIDFFAPEYRHRILQRDGHQCFYCGRAVTSANYVIEHVTSRPNGDNSYRNLVTGCRECNNRKKEDAEAFLRLLYREDFLTAQEFRERIARLEKLRAGELKP